MQIVIFQGVVYEVLESSIYVVYFIWELLSYETAVPQAV